MSGDLKRALADQGLMTVGQAATELGLGRELLLEHLAANRLPSVKVEWKGNMFTRMRIADVQALKVKMGLS